jgi:D-alanine-D-alanine ligase
MESKHKTVVVLCGGYSSEHKISVASGRTAEAAFLEAGYTVLFVELTKEGFHLNGRKVILGSLDADYVFNVIHGTPGEDGHISGMLEVLGIPHSTCNTFQSALTFNKSLCNRVLAQEGVPVPKGKLFTKTPDFATEFSHWNFPVFVKPNRSGSSFGVTRVETIEALEAAFEYAFSEDSQVLVEEGVIGVEVGCGVLGSSFDFEKGTSESFKAQTIAITEIVPTESKFFDYQAKYEGKSQEITPARISKAAQSTIERLSLLAYERLDLKGIVRIDFIIQENDQPVMIEINSIPGMSPASIIPQQIRSRNWSLPLVLSTMAEEIMANYQGNK